MVQLDLYLLAFFELRRCFTDQELNELLVTMDDKEIRWMQKMDQE
jgi:hypothetical protein